MIKNESFHVSAGIGGFFSFKRDWKSTTVLRYIIDDNIPKEALKTAVHIRNYCRIYKQAPEVIEFEIELLDLETCMKAEHYFRELLENQEIKWNGITIKNIIRNSHLDLKLFGGDDQSRNVLEKYIREKIG